MGTDSNPTNGANTMTQPTAYDRMELALADNSPAIKLMDLATKHARTVVLAESELHKAKRDRRIKDRVKAETEVSTAGITLGELCDVLCEMADLGWNDRTNLAREFIGRAHQWKRDNF